MFNRRIIFQKQNGSQWEKLCNDKDLEAWKYLFKTYGWEIIEIQVI